MNISLDIKRRLLRHLPKKFNIYKNSFSPLRYLSAFHKQTVLTNMKTEWNLCLSKSSRCWTTGSYARLASGCARSRWSVSTWTLLLVRCGKMENSSLTSHLRERNRWEWRPDWLNCWLIGRLIDWLIGRLIGWFVGWLAGWLAGCKTNYLRQQILFTNKLLD